MISERMLELMCIEIALNNTSTVLIEETKIIRMKEKKSELIKEFLKNY